jgi:hypothetical protein
VIGTLISSARVDHEERPQPVPGGVADGQDRSSPNSVAPPSITTDVRRLRVGKKARAGVEPFDIQGGLADGSTPWDRGASGMVNARRRCRPVGSGATAFGSCRVWESEQRTKRDTDGGLVDGGDRCVPIERRAGPALVG